MSTKQLNLKRKIVHCFAKNLQMEKFKWIFQPIKFNRSYVTVIFIANKICDSLSALGTKRSHEENRPSRCWQFACQRCRNCSTGKCPKYSQKINCDY